MGRHAGSLCTPAPGDTQKLKINTNILLGFLQIPAYTASKATPDLSPRLPYPRRWNFSVSSFGNFYFYHFVIFVSRKARGKQGKRGDGHLQRNCFRRQGFLLPDDREPCSATNYWSHKASRCIVGRVSRITNADMFCRTSSNGQGTQRHRCLGSETILAG